MKDFTKYLPKHTEIYVGEQDLFLEIFELEGGTKPIQKRAPILFVHGAYTGSWMWSKYLPHFLNAGWTCYAMNLRSHHKSRSMDLSKVTFEDYLEDIREVLQLIGSECGEPPIVIGFSMGGILCQKLAEAQRLTGLVLVDSSVSREVFEKVPYGTLCKDDFGLVVPAPIRDKVSIDETEEDIACQIKYLSMESTNAFRSCGCWVEGVVGISVDSRRITCPTLVIKALSSEEDDRRGKAEAEHLHGEYSGFWNTSHTGLLVGQHYKIIVDKILQWLDSFHV